MQLSPHFTLEEFTHSNTAFRKKIDNTPSQESIANIRYLCAEVLEPIRAHFGAPIEITSGYRCPSLCRAIGSKPTSQHTAQRQDAAVDFHVVGVPNDVVADWIRHNLEFDQLILEGPPGSRGWVHCSYTYARKQRKMVGLMDAAGYYWGDLRRP